MTSFAILACVLAALAGLEIFVPGRDVYHAGWFNVALAAIAVVMLSQVRRRLAATERRVPTAAFVLGASIAAMAAIANGLFAPDNRTVVGAPGQRVRVEDAGGSLQFPIVPNAAQGPGRVAFDGPPVRSFVFKDVDRTVVAVEARDLRGAHLTVTQPTGNAFLSPVLMMQQRQTIAGMNVPFDSFAVPAAHRVVKAVLFTPQQAAMLRGLEGLEVPAVLFAADDENDRPLPHAIALSVGGQTVAVGGLLLRATVLQYPAVEIIAVPSPAAVALSALLVIGGLLWEFSSLRAARREST